MPVPSSVDDFIGLVRKSGVLEEKRLDAHLDKLRATSSLPAEPAKIAGLLVRDGLLTKFQAEQFLQGKWRRFTIGKYKVLERIGSGGMGSVYLCEHKFMRRRAAVKVLPTAKAADPSALERFYREARAVAALDHPNIVRAYDIDQEENLHFLVMEYVDGASLQELVKKNGPLDPAEAANYVSQSALGLQHAHEVAGLVHRDIKPGNLIVDRGGVVKILDMGLARFFHDEEDVLTKKYDENVLGTADYLAPEQALDSHGADIRADIYSLGATFYFCLTGKTPFSEGSVAQKLIWHQTRQPKPIRTFRRDVPDGMLAVIDKMMAKDPAQRYQLPGDIITALAPWTKQTAAAESAPPAPSNDKSAKPVPQKPDTPPKTVSLPKPASSKDQAQGKTAGKNIAKPKSEPPKSPAPAPKKELPAAPVSTADQPPESSEFPTPSDSTPETSPQLAEPDFQAPAATAAEPGSDEDSLLWEKLGPDTADSSDGADTDPRSQTKALSSVHLRRSQSLWSQDRRRLWWVLGIAAAIILILVAILTLLALLPNAPSKRAGTGSTSEGVRLLVNRAGQGGAFKSIGEALTKARDNDVLVVQDDLEEQLILPNRRRITIETDGNRPLVWRCPQKPADSRQMILLNDAEGFHLKGFVLDGRDHVDQVLVVAGRCAGLTLENLELRGFQHYGMVIANSEGRPESPLTLFNVQITTTKQADAAVAFHVYKNISPNSIQHVAIQKCRFNGKYKSVIEKSDPGILHDASWAQNLVQGPNDKSPVPFEPPS